MTVSPTARSSGVSIGGRAAEAALCAAGAWRNVYEDADAVAVAGNLNTIYAFV